MWVVTQNGFYSVVAVDRQKFPSTRRGQLLMVRGRAKEDFDALLRSIPDAEVLETKVADYRYRVIVTKTEWDQFMSDEAGEIDYPNFKNRVMKTQGLDRERIYMDVWSALNRIDKRPVTSPHLTGGGFRPDRVSGAGVLPHRGQDGQRATQKCDTCGLPTFVDLLDSFGDCPTCAREWDERTVENAGASRPPTPLNYDPLTDEELAALDEEDDLLGKLDSDRRLVRAWEEDGMIPVASINDEEM